MALQSRFDGAAYGREDRPATIAPTRRSLVATFPPSGTRSARPGSRPPPTVRPPDGRALCASPTDGPAGRWALRGPALARGSSPPPPPPSRPPLSLATPPVRT